jgi:hypothetical protein
MNDPEELNLTLLERSLEEHEHARSNLSRDLKVAGVLLLAFQFFVFFRFARLSDQQFELQPQLEQTEAQHQALVEVRGAVEKIETALKAGSTELATILSDLPQRIRKDLGELDRDLTTFQSQPLPPRDARPLQQMQMQQQIPNAAFNVARPDHAGSASRFFADLTTAESEALHGAEVSSPVFRERIVHIVEHQIIEPAFAHLNERAEELVVKPLETGLAELRQRTAALATLKANGADVEGWLANAEQVVAIAKNLRFSPPAEVDWWTSAVAKGAYADTAKLDTVRIADEARSALSRPDAELKSLAEKMESALASLLQQGSRIDAELKQLREHALSLEGLIEGYAKPLAVLALEPKDLVIFYPVILAAIVSLFAVRQVLLRRRAATLEQAYRELGVSARVLAVYFTELPERSDHVETARARFSQVRRFAGWLWVIPAGFAITSFACVLASKSLGGEAPRLLYSLSAVVLVMACLFLLRSSREPLKTA